MLGDCCCPAGPAVVMFGEDVSWPVMLFGDCPPGEIKLLIESPIWSNTFCALAVCINGIKNIENSKTVIYFIINTIIIIYNDLNFVLVKKIKY